MTEEARAALGQFHIDGKILLSGDLALRPLQPSEEALCGAARLTDLGGLLQALAERPSLGDAINIADLADLGKLSDVAALTGAIAGLKLLRLKLEPAQISEADRRLFDTGFVRVRTARDPWPGDGTTSYIRSDLIDDLDVLGEATGGVIAMSSLGNWGRFANQLFQYVFLKLYGLRANATPQFPPWVGTMLYGAVAPVPQPGLVMQSFPEFNGIERYLWDADEPQVNVNFVGFFQELPPSWRHHKTLIRLLLRPAQLFSGPIDNWLAATRQPGSTLVGIHIRRGDYGNFDHDRFPWFQFIPVDWYLDLLDSIWSAVANPVLLFASDEPNLSLRFRSYNPIRVPAAELIGPDIGYFGDFHALGRCDQLTVINSSYSRMAALLADDSQITYIPDMVERRFVPYNPWEDEFFWQRFEVRLSEPNS